MRLKPIPQNTVVHTPTEAEAKELLAILHENGYKWNNRDALDRYTKRDFHKNETCYKIYIGDMAVTYSTKGYFEGNKETILTLAEFKERYCEQEKPQPKVKLGDIVRIINDCGCNAYGLVGVVESVGPKSVDVTCDDIKLSCLYEWIEPYTEPETKPTEDMETIENRNLSQVVANCDKSEDKQLNLCELLKGHEGERFYSPAFEDVKLINSRLEENRICIDTLSCFGRVQLMENGTVVGPGECILFPSRALYEQYPLDPYTAWMKWQEEQRTYEINISIDYCENFMGVVDATTLTFRTPANRDKCISEIKAIIEKYSEK